MRAFRIVYLVTLCSLLSSCIKDEPLNAECDIERAWVHTDDPKDLFFNATDTLVDVLSTVNDIVFTVKANADVSAMAPMFRITEGATITPANGSVHDFSGERPVQYTVTSEDGQWSRTYNVSFAPPRIVLKYDFENYNMYVEPNFGITKYYTWQEMDNDGTMLNVWATGNPGFAMSNGKTLPEDYPTTPLADGYDGAGVKLVTRSTGTWGLSMHKPIAAGNLFLGSFNPSMALVGNGLRSTNFGIRFNKEPRRLRGYYKYRPGETYQDQNLNVIADKRDCADIYAVLYRNHDAAGNEVMLHGDDVLTSPSIVAIARVADVKTTDEWTPFDVNFVYNEAIDPNLLSDYGYNIAVVFSSSVKGAYFEGAIGSTLCIDKVSLECNDEKEKDNEQ